METEEIDGQQSFADTNNEFAVWQVRNVIQDGHPDYRKPVHIPHDHDYEPKRYAGKHRRRDSIVSLRRWTWWINHGWQGKHRKP